ncbi:MAG TPA: peptidoglycan bridge formation glycyltransferase FemA/FemB family protein [Bacillota bacterium]|nr:peptidoglycan bridge formation glycyltransferase FemA/FemB family protein [Bacillota bacterium]
MNASGGLRWRLVTDPGERGRWNAFVGAADSGNLLQSWEWGEIRARQHWQPYRVAVEDRQGNLRAAASALARRAPLLGTLLYLPGGPVLDYSDGAALDAATRALRELGRRLGTVSVKIDPHVAPASQRLHRVLFMRGYRIGHRRGRFEGTQPRYRVVVPLPASGDADALLASFHSKTRYNIRLAERRGVTVARVGRERLADFHRMLEVTCARDGFKERNSRYFEQVWDGLDGAGMVFLFFAQHEGDDLACAILTVIGHEAVYAWGASENLKRNLMAPYAVQWAMMRFALERGCTRYDMTGVPKDLREGVPGYGLYRFKRGFHDEVTVLQGEYDLPLRPLRYRLWLRAEPLWWRTQVAISRLRSRPTGEES